MLWKEDPALGKSSAHGTVPSMSCSKPAASLHWGHWSISSHPAAALVLAEPLCALEQTPETGFDFL